jgi:hypothetical protein
MIVALMRFRMERIEVTKRKDRRRKRSESDSQSLDNPIL